MDYRLPGASVHGILQARILEWVAISFSRGYSKSRNQTFGVFGGTFKNKLQTSVGFPLNTLASAS